MKILQWPLTPRYVISLALPVAILLIYLCVYRFLLMGTPVITTPGVASLLMTFNWLLPGFAAWLLSERICDLRVWLWLLAISFIFCLPFLFLFVLFVLFFSLHKWLRLAGLVLLAPMTLLGAFFFLICFSAFYSHIAEGKAADIERPLELVKVGRKDVYIYPENYSALDPYIYVVRVERKLNSFLALRKTVYSKPYGAINNLKVLDAHTIQFDVTTNPDYSREPVGPITKQIRID